MITWKEFKEQVEKRIAELGLTEDVEISYIDAGGFGKEVDVELSGASDDCICIYS